MNATLQKVSYRDLPTGLLSPLFSPFTAVLTVCSFVQIIIYTITIPSAQIHMSTGTDVLLTTRAQTGSMFRVT